MKETTGGTAVGAVIIPRKMIFENKESDYRIYSCNVKSSEVIIDIHPKFQNISIKGKTTALVLGEEYNVQLQSGDDPDYPYSYTLAGLTYEFPKDTASQRKYMEAVVNKNKVASIYDYYTNGEDVIKLIQDGKFDYEAIKGFGEKTYEQLKRDIMSRSGSKELTSLLGAYDVSLTTIDNILEHYDYNDKLAVEKIKDNPYVITDVSGIGFKKADFIALKMGFSRVSEARINNAIRFIIEETTKNGDTWITKNDLIVKSSGLMGINKKYVEEELLTKRYEDFQVLDVEGKFTSRNNYNNEREVSSAIIESNADSISYFTDEEITAFLNEYQVENNIQLEEKQIEFFYNWNNNTVSFLVGGAGMGKTALMNILVKLLATKDIKSALMAPTGKSSKVLSEYTNQNAFTVHRALNIGGSLQIESEKDYFRENVETEEEREERLYNEEGSIRIQKPPITVRHIIVDEVSMMDVQLASSLFRQINLNRTKILFVGDDYQLPSVGVGNFLYDCINSGIAVVTRLQKVFRQDEGGILDIATKVRQGKPFLTRNMEGAYEFGNDCIIDLTNQISIPFAVDYYYEQFLDEGLLPENIMVLSPTKVGKSGTVSLNNRIQEVISPEGKPSYKGLKINYDNGEDVIFHVGDLIINTSNDYKRSKFDYVSGIYITSGKADIFNGDTGVIVGIVGKEVYAKFDGIIFCFSEIDMKRMMLHSYCITIHKSQGNSETAVILVLDKSATFQLNANLIYTGITRAKEKLVILGQANTIINGGRKFVNMKRKSFLCDMLQGKI